MTNVYTLVSAMQFKKKKRKWQRYKSFYPALKSIRFYVHK